MKEKGYNVRGLYIVTTKETRNIKTLHDESAAKIVKFIKRVVQKGQLKYFQLCGCNMARSGNKATEI